MEQDGKQSEELQGEIFREGATDILAPTAKNLIVIGAAVALNCHTCLNYLIPAALRNGVLEEEIEAAISLVGQIKGNSARFTDRLVADLLLQQGTAGESKSECC